MPQAGPDDCTDDQPPVIAPGPVTGPVAVFGKATPGYTVDSEVEYVCCPESAVQEPAPFRVGLEVQQAVEERLEPGHLLVTPRQRAGGDEGLAQVGESRALGQSVECLVIGRTATGVEGA